MGELRLFNLHSADGGPDGRHGLQAARRSPSKRPASGDVLEHLDPTSFVGRRRRLKSSLRAALLLWSRSSS